MISKRFLLVALAFATALLVTSEIVAARELASNNESAKWFKGVPVKNTVSGVWKKIDNVNKDLLKVNVNIHERLRCMVGNGKDVAFWTDSWLNGVPLCDSHSDIFKIAKNKKARVADNYCKVGSLLMWKWDWKRDPHRKEEWEEVGYVMKLLGEVSLSGKEDRWIWVNDDGVDFSVKKVRSEVNGNITTPSFDQLFFWNSWVIRKVSTFVWRACMDRIPTMEALCRRGVVVASTLCPSCGMVEETVDHLFAKCEVPKAIWWQICRWVKIPIPISFASVGEMLDFANENGGEGNMKKVIKLIFHATIWRIWLARNDKVFKGINTSCYKVVEEVKELSFLWISNRSRFNMAGWEMWKNFRFG
ncbi:hypothetical protein E3N88_34476 [Mikania micrantha]|uniref:Reverse transcriptase zinc-binding domain-containing protein n=1 Tax=Mikania micrantha TaxID=192012 RepID=A0A5N6LZ39_9ASTR|nr:hypothetical protein E3N88_34476 [Mikania micrantha]